MFEDDNILVVNKPSTVPIYPTGDYRLNTLLYILAHEKVRKYTGMESRVGPSK